MCHILGPLLKGKLGKGQYIKSKLTYQFKAINKRRKKNTFLKEHLRETKNIYSVVVVNFFSSEHSLY